MIHDVFTDLETISAWTCFVKLCMVPPIQRGFLLMPYDTFFYEFGFDLLLVPWKYDIMIFSYFNYRIVYIIFMPGVTMCIAVKLNIRWFAMLKVIS